VSCSSIDIVVVRRFSHFNTKVASCEETGFLLLTRSYVILGMLTDKRKSSYWFWNDNRFYFFGKW